MLGIQWFFRSTTDQHFQGPLTEQTEKGLRKDVSIQMKNFSKC